MQKAYQAKEQSMQSTKIKTVFASLLSHAALPVCDLLSKKLVKELTVAVCDATMFNSYSWLSTKKYSLNKCDKK